MSPSATSAVDRIVARLAEAPFGLHDLGEPRSDCPIEWPRAMVAVYAAMDGAHLFLDSLILLAGNQLERTERGWKVGNWHDRDVWVDERGAVWIRDPDTDDDVQDGSSFDRWLHGAIDADALLFDGDGEYAEGVFDEEGDLNDETQRARLRAQLRRDKRAPAPRWYLAQLLAQNGDIGEARIELEEVVAIAPEFSWAWLDLARLSERLGEKQNAIDEAWTAAEAAQRIHHGQTAYFWSQAARIAAAAGDEPRRSDAARRALALDPGLVQGQLAGAAQNLDDGDVESARGLLELAKAIAPRDLKLLDLARRLDERDEQELN